MTLGLTLIIVLSALVVALGMAVYHLTTRVSSLETAVDGGLRTPERPLASAEFAARFAQAGERAELAREIGDGVALFVDTDSPSSTQLLDTVAALGTGRGLHLIFKGAAPAPQWPSDTTIHQNLGGRFDPAGIVATPFGMLISDGRVLDAELLGSTAALDQFLSGGIAPQISQTPLEVD
jgi:hypothetical protein